MSHSLQDDYDYLFKIVLIGDCGVGKTCVVQRFKAGTYVERCGNTIGVDFTMKEVMVDDKKVKLQIWDTAGQERFRTITQSYYRNAHGIIIVYDITKRATFLSVQRWLDEVRKYTASNVLIILIGNKSDLESQREVEPAESEALVSATPDITTLLETSAKDDTNITDVFVTMARVLKEQYGTSVCMDAMGHVTGGAIRLNSSSVREKWKCCS